MYDSRPRKRETLPYLPCLIPGNIRFLGSTTQPLDPETFHAVTKSLQTFHIAADTVVSEVPLNLASQHPILLKDWQMPIPATPPRDAFIARLP